MVYFQKISCRYSKVIFVSQLLLNIQTIYILYSQTFMQAYCIDKYQSFCYVLYSYRTIVLSLDKTHVSHMCPKITDETHCDAFCVKTATKKREKVLYNTEQWTLNRTVLFILIWHYKLRVKAPKNFILWEKMWKVSLRTGKWKIQRETFPPLATASQSKAEKWELELFEEMLLTSRAVGRGYNDRGVSYYLETSSIFYT